MFFAVKQPHATDVQGLYVVLNVYFNTGGLMVGSISLWALAVVGANMAAGGLRGYLEAWVVVFWCLAHRCELSGGCSQAHFLLKGSRNAHAYVLSL